MSCKKLLFLYDKLMTRQEQSFANLNLKFISYATVHGKLIWVNDTKRKRTIIIPSTTTSSLVYGGLFICEDYNVDKYKLHAYYNNSIPYIGNTALEDIYDLSTNTAIPILFKNIKDIEKNKYEKGTPVECSSFVANFLNSDVNYALSKQYHKMKGVDAKYYIQMIKENSRNE